MDDKTKSQEQLETKNEINKEESKIKRKKVNPLFIVLALFVLFSLIPVIGYLLFKYNVGNVFKENESCKVNRQAVCDPTREESEDGSGTEVIDTKQNKLEVVNKGWALFYDADLKVSIEIPNYTANVAGGASKSEWSGKIDSYNTDSYFGKQIKTISIDFWPANTSDLGGCGGGCWGEHHVSVTAYENKGNLTLEQVKDKYILEIGKMGDTEVSGETATKLISKWGSQVYEYKWDVIDGTIEGYLIVKNNFIYDINYFFSTQNLESKAIALKVLDSIKFN